MLFCAPGKNILKLGVNEGTKRAVTAQWLKRGGIQACTFREAEAPFVEEASRAQQFYLSFLSVGTLSSVFGWCLGINVECDAAGGWELFKRGWKMEHRRSWSK